MFTVCSRMLHGKYVERYTRSYFFLPGLCLLSLFASLSYGHKPPRCPALSLMGCHRYPPSKTHTCNPQTLSTSLPHVHGHLAPTTMPTFPSLQTPLSLPYCLIFVSSTQEEFTGLPGIVATHLNGIAVRRTIINVRAMLPAKSTTFGTAGRIKRHEKPKPF